MIVSLPKSLTDRPVLLSCLVFTSVAAIWYLQRKSSSNHQVFFNEAILSYHLNRPRYLTTSGTGFKGVPPISTVSTPIHRLSQLWSKLAALLRIPISNQIYLHAKNSSKIMFVWWTPSDSDVSSANSAVLPHIRPLASWCAVPHLKIQVWENQNLVLDHYYAGVHCA